QYEPEFVKNYEVSYKGAFENGLSFSSNVFYLDWKDQQVLEQALGSPFTRTVNAGKSTVYGGELELAWRNTQWDTYATFGYNHSEFDEFVSSGNDLSGNAFPSSPSVTAAVGGFYSIDKWVYGAEVNYRDGNYTSVDNAFETDSLTLVDLSVSYEFERFTVRGFVNNAFDEIIQVNETFVIEGIPHGNFTAPRTIGLQVMFGY
ncbi:MAG: TonB-dependent receptor, partial [Verrucomicrobiota bacterium]